MTDSLYVAGTIAFFALMLAFAAGVARLSSKQGDHANTNEPR
jgi:hypothetical protein